MWKVLLGILIGLAIGGGLTLFAFIHAFQGVTI
jgi:hypothetical protein